MPWRERYNWRGVAFLALIVVLAAVFVVFAAKATQAAEIDDKTSCTVMIAAFEARDFPQIRAFGAYILRTMDDLDMRHTRAGEPGIMAQLSREGRLKMVPITSVNCRDHPKMTVYKSAAFVYTGMRELEIQLGVAK